MIYPRNFGKGPTIGSQDTVQTRKSRAKADAWNFSVSITVFLKSKSKSLKSNQCFFYVPMMYLCKFGKNPATYSEDIVPARTFQPNADWIFSFSTAVALKMRLMSLKFDQFFIIFQLYIRKN